jgi:TetR/AcrR family transcriptional repressor for divergent bdcA
MDAKKSCGRRGRPRGFCPDQAAEKAMRLFASRGYDGIGIAELSEELGINPPSLYAAFGSKRGLFERALELYAERFGGDLPKALESEERLEDAISALLAAAADAYTRDREAAGCMVIEGARGGAPDVCPMLNEAQAAIRHLILERIRRGGAPSPELLCDYVIAVLRGLSASARRGMDRDRLRGVAAIAAQGFAARLTGR